MSRKRSRLIWSILFLFPAVTLFTVFLLNPVFQAVYMSFFKWNGIASAKLVPVGWSNYQAVMQSSNFWLAMRNSLYFMLGGFLVLMPLAFTLAFIITSKIKFCRFFKVAYYIPVMLPVTAVGLIWVYILQPNWGLVNTFLNQIGLAQLAINWLGEKTVNVICVVLVNEWIFAGFNMLIFAAGLVAIPQDVYESALMDGAGKWQTLRYITIPLMKESFKIFSVLCICGCLKTFDLMFTMTGGGPNHSSEVPATLLYTEAFSSKNFGRGNAIGVIILAVGLLLSLGLNKFLASED